MANRTRSYDNGFFNGTWRRFGNTSTPNWISTENGTCKDTRLPGDNFDLYIDKFYRSGGVINSKFDPGYFGTFWQNFTMDGIAGWWFPTEFTYPGELPTSTYALQAVARTNPSRAYVDVPINVLELGDIPLLIKNKGDTLLKKLGNWNLTYEFGIKPIVGDLIKLSHFADQLSRRIKEVEKLKSSHGLRRTVQLDQLSTQVSAVRIMQSAGSRYDLRTDSNAVRTIRGHCRWVPDVNFGRIDNQAMTRKLSRAVLGLTVDFSTVWEVLPWSWLIDWCSDVGLYFQANRNIIPARLDSVRVIRHSQVTHVVYPFEDANVKITQGVCKRDTKERLITTVTPTAHFPFLSESQLGILASLAVTRT